MKIYSFFFILLLFGIAFADDVKDFLVSHNTYRCLHDTPLLEWDTCVAASAQSWANKGQFVHSDAYSLKPCEGPSGENLAQGHSSIVAAVKAWYDERPIWEESSKNDFISSAGHYTAMMWKGLKKLGCGVQNRLYVCRYKGDDVLNCNTPNMGGCYTTQVLSLDTSLNESDCQAVAEAHYNKTVLGQNSTSTTTIPVTTTSTTTKSGSSSTTTKAQSTTSTTTKTSSTTSTSTTSTTSTTTSSSSTTTSTTVPGQLGCVFENTRFYKSGSLKPEIESTASSAGNCLFLCLLRGSSCASFTFSSASKACSLFKNKPPVAERVWESGWYSGLPTCNLDDYDKYLPSTTTTTSRQAVDSTTTRARISPVTKLDSACSFEKIDFDNSSDISTSYFVSSPLTCLNKCLDNSKCIAYTHIKGIISRCHLKTDASKATSRSSATSGIVDCYTNANYTPYSDALHTASIPANTPSLKDSVEANAVFLPFQAAQSSSFSEHSSSTPSLLNHPFEVVGVTGSSIHIQNLEKFMKQKDDTETKDKFVVEGVFTPVAEPKRND